MEEDPVEEKEHKMGEVVVAPSDYLLDDIIDSYPIEGTEIALPGPDSTVIGWPISSRGLMWLLSDMVYSVDPVDFYDSSFRSSRERLAKASFAIRLEKVRRVLGYLAWLCLQNTEQRYGPNATDAVNSYNGRDNSSALIVTEQYVVNLISHARGISQVCDDRGYSWGVHSSFVSQIRHLLAAFLTLSTNHGRDLGGASRDRIERKLRESGVFGST